MRSKMSHLNSSSPAPKLLTVCMHLGMNIEQVGDEWHVKKNEQSVIGAALEALKLDEGIECVNIGCVGKQVPAGKQDTLTSELMLNHGCYPLFLTQEEAEDFYHRFCKGVLWPTMNYSLATSRRFHGIEELWVCHRKIMTYIADTVTTLYRPGDVIWIHDYHLLCLPAFIRRRCPEARVGFYLHCTFPASELFRQIPIRESILQGLCCADVIGFQTYNYCRYFLRSVSSLLGWETGPTSVTCPDGRVCRVHVDPTGLKVSLYESKLRATIPLAEKWRKGMYSNSKIIVGRCRRLDKYQGIVEKLLAFDHFLTKHPDYIEKVILVQSIIDNETVSREKEEISNAQLEAVYEERNALVERVEELVGRINGIHGTLAWQPVHIHIKPHDNIEMSMALDQLADVVMITPTRDGMNLIAHESILATQNSHAPLILSEFAGAASCLGGSILVNPYDKTAMANALVRALTMSPAEKKMNHSHNLLYVKQNCIGQWAKLCIETLISDEDEGSQHVKLMGNVLVDFMRAYKMAEKRLLLIDYEATAAMRGTDNKWTVPDDTKKYLHRLMEDENNYVFLMTGEPKQAFEDEESLRGIGVCAYYGLHTRYPKEDRWRGIEKSIDLAWKEPIRGLFNDFCDRIPGTTIDESNMIMTWLYDKADQDFATWLVQDLLLVLHQMADKCPIHISTTKSSIQVRPRALSPSAVYYRIMATLQGVDTVYRIGADDLPPVSDSSLASSANSNQSGGPVSPTSPKMQPACYTCTVGERPRSSTANGFYVTGQGMMVGV
eukprot:TRINITY_DN3189_c0_g1_i2.p1 TRINITY_DN3189_c0_g1~~TRINITY_DN3189_c0_g1_i2.p1  ORF type:complete len:778 (+),score=225.01 TRINITY_DN3189_c0_g1_i2:51-2384(+)